MKSDDKRLEYRQYKPLLLLGAIFCIALFLVNFTSAFTWGVDNHLQAYYQFQETTGVVNDSLGFYNGTNVGATRGATGKIGFGVDFESSATSQFVRLNDMTFTDQITVSQWVKPESIVSYGGIVSQDPDNSWSLDNGLSGVPRLRLDTGVSGPTTTSATTTMTAGTWYHLVWTFNGTDVRMWVNGQNEVNYSGQDNGNIQASANNITVGYENAGGDRWYDGIIDEVGLWNVTLSDTEILELYNFGNGLQYGETVASPDNVELTLISPTNDTIITDTGTNFTAYFNVTSGVLNWTNATYYIFDSDDTIFNQTTVTISTNNTYNITFIDDFTLGQYKWNVMGCYANSTFSNCTWSSEGNYSFTVGATLSNVTYNNFTYETSRQNFTGVLTLLDDTELYDVKLVYNSVEYTGYLTNLGSNVFQTYGSIDLPTVTTATNYTYFFKLIYSLGNGNFLYENSTSYNQSVYPISLYKCNSLTNQTLNFSAADEENLTSLTPFNFLGTFEYWIGQGDVRKNVSINNLSVNDAQLCINPNNYTYYSDAIIQYEKDGYVKRNYYLYNASLTNSSQNITLYLIDSTVATSFIVSVKDGSQLPITDAYIYVQRYYPGTGLFQTVAMAKTDGGGNTVAHFEAETEDYRIIVTKNGEVIYTSPIQKVYCSATPCTLPIQTESGGVSGWTRIGNLSNLIYSGPSYNSTTGMITYTYIDTSGTTSYGRLFVYTINPSSGRDTICNTNSTSNAATLTCDVSNVTGRVYAEAYISRSPETFVNAVSWIINTVKTIMGFEGLFWAFIIITVLALGGAIMGGVPGGIIGVIIGFIGTAMLGIASWGAVSVWGIIILGVFIIWQIKS